MELFATTVKLSHVIELPFKTPPLLMLLILLYPFGTKSSTETPVPLLGPSFPIVIVNVTMSPTFGDASLTSLIKYKSATPRYPASILSIVCPGTKVKF